MSQVDGRIIITAEEFRQDYPEFTVEKYPDAAVNSKINLAYCYISNQAGQAITDDCRTQAIELMVAHLLTLGSGSANGESGGGAGLATSTKIGDISVTLAQPVIKSQWQYWINSTPYGQQYYALLMSHASVPRYRGGTMERVFWTSKRGWL